MVCIKVLPVALFFLTSIEHMFAETSSKIDKGSIITRIFGDKPSDDGTISSSCMLFPFFIIVDNRTLRYDDVCCYLLGSGLLKNFLALSQKRNQLQVQHCS